MHEAYVAPTMDLSASEISTALGCPVPHTPRVRAQKAQSLSLRQVPAAELILLRLQHDLMRPRLLQKSSHHGFSFAPTNYSNRIRRGLGRFRRSLEGFC